MATTGDYIKMHFIVFLWGFTAILGKLITIPSVEMVFYRTALAAAGMALVIFYTGGRFRIGAADGTRLILTGFIVAIHWITFFGSARLANISVSLVGSATASLWAAFLEPLAQGKKIKTLEVLLGSAVIAGIGIIFSFRFEHGLGLLVAIFSGLTVAIFSIINAKLVARIHPYTITLYEMIGAAAGIALFLPIYTNVWTASGTLTTPTGMDWFYIGILALVCTVYAYSVMVDLLKRLSVFLMQLTINLEPVYGIIMAVLVFGDQEKMSGSFYAGAVIILSAVVLYPLFKRKFEKVIA